MHAIPRRQLAIALLFITPAFWSVNYLVARSAPGVIGPHLLALLRWSVAGLLFAVPVWGELVRHRRQILREWRRYLLLGALGMWICGAWVYIGGQTTTALNIALIYALSPVLIALVSAVWLREPFHRVQGVGVALALAGVVHVIVQDRWMSLASVAWAPEDAWIVCATLS